MPIRAVVFDMDGVLIDSEPLYNKADAVLFASLGLPFGAEEIAAVTGVSHKVFGKWAKDRYRHLTQSEDELSRLYAENLLSALKTNDVAIEPGVLQWLARFQKQGVKLAIASSSTSEMVGHIVERFGFGQYMEAVITGSDVDLGKPYPDIFLKAAQRLGVPPCDCLAVEDSTNGIKAALSAGMTCLAYTATNRHGLDQSKAHLFCNRFDDANWDACIAPLL